MHKLQYQLVEIAYVTGYDTSKTNTNVKDWVVILKQKKIVGTGILALFMVAAVAVYTGTAQALYRYIGSDFRATGKVTQVGGSSFELTTSGSTWPLTMITNAGTDFSGGYGSFGDVHVGDEVRVVANRDTGDFLTLEVAKQADPGTYGNTTCDSFVISSAIFERPVNNTIYVVKDNIGVRINVDGDTQYVGGTMADVLPGSQVIISGYDCRTTGQLTAQTVHIVKNEALDACNSFGANAIVARNYSVLLAHDAPSAKTPKINVTVPAGNYDVYGVSFDNHSTSPWDTQAHEQWYATGYAGNNLVATSGTTDDLPNGVDFNTTKLNTGLQIDSALTAVQLVHAVQPGTDGYQSIYPVCVVFQPAASQEVEALPTRD